MSLILRVEDVCVGLPDGRGLVEGLTLEARKHRVVHVRGASGVGKSTLLHALFTPRTSQWKGLRSQHQTKRWPKHTMLVQQSPMLDWLSPKDNALTPDEQLLDAWPEMVEHLSGGQRQKIAWMRAMAQAPTLLILDEPLAGLDIETKALLTAKMCEHVDCGGAIVLITHDAVLIDALGDRVDVVTVEKTATSDKIHAGQYTRRMHLMRLCQAIVPLYPTHLAGQWRRALWRALLGQALHMRYMGFFLGTGAMLGASLTLVLVRLGSGWIGAQTALDQFALKPIEWLAAPLAGILAATTVGNALGAWLGNQSLRRVPGTLEGLGVDAQLALWRPTFFACWLGAQMHTLIFILGMLIGTWSIAKILDLTFLPMTTAWQLMAQPHVFSSVFTYPLCVALVCLWHASEPVEQASDVTSAMIRVTTWSTLCIVAMEFVRAIVQT